MPRQGWWATWSCDRDMSKGVITLAVGTRV